MATPFGQALDAGNPPPSAPSEPYKGYSGGDALVASAEATVVPGVPLLEGWEQWLPPKPAAYKDGMPIYEVQGTDAQIVQFPVRPGRAIMCFSGYVPYARG